MKGVLFPALPLFNRPKFYGRHIESRSTGMTKKGPVLMSCLIVMQSHLTFSRGRVKPKCGEFVTVINSNYKLSTNAKELTKMNQSAFDLI